MHRELFVAGLKGSRGKLAPTGGGYNCSRPSVSLSTANIASGGGFDMQAGVIQRALTVGASLPRELFVAGLKGSRASSLLQGGGYNCSRPRVSLSTANIASRSTREVTAGVIQRALTVGASLPRELFVAGLKGSRASSLLQGGGYNCSRPRVSLSTANIASRSTREVTSAGAKMMASPVVLTCRPASYSARWTRAPLAPGASPGVS